MSSTFGTVACPRCKRDSCNFDLNIKTMNEFMLCGECGYYRNFFFQRDEEGRLLKKDPERGYERDNLIERDIHLEDPYGAYRFESDDTAFGTRGTLATKEDLHKLVSHIGFLSEEEKKRVRLVEVSRLVGDSIEKEVLFQNKP
jgi:hypothetical protein